MTPKELEHYVGRPFVRVSPITGGRAEGIVKWIGVHCEWGFKEPGLENLVTFRLTVTSTQGVSYELTECHFESPTVKRFNEVRARGQPFHFLAKTL